MDLAKKRLKVKEIIVNADWCKGCGICVAFCPTQVFDMSKEKIPVVARLEKCISCDLCELRCPDVAITLVKGED